MNKDKILRFEDSEKYFCCPICHKRLAFHQNSLICKNKHCYDISKYGYVNLLLKGKSDEHYSKESFANRKFILENGFYSHIVEEILNVINGMDSVQTVLDVGCGEGFYSRKLIESTTKTILAFDISKDSIQMAAKNDRQNRGKWFVSDLANLPIQNKAIDCILDIFSPSNYSEFYRVLQNNGYIIKVVPTSDHLRELREKASEYLTHKSYSNENVLDYFSRYFAILHQKEVVSTYELSPEERSAFLNMTPLLFNVDKGKIDWSDITKITIGATILIGKR